MSLLLCALFGSEWILCVSRKRDQKVGRGMHINSLAPLGGAFSLSLHDEPVRTN